QAPRIWPRSCRRRGNRGPPSLPSRIAGGSRASQPIGIGILSTVGVRRRDAGLVWLALVRTGGCLAKAGLRSFFGQPVPVQPPVAVRANSLPTPAAINAILTDGKRPGDWCKNRRGLIGTKAPTFKANVRPSAAGVRTKRLDQKHKPTAPIPPAASETRH